MLHWSTIKYPNEAFACLLLISLVYDGNNPISGVDWAPYNLFREHLMYFMIFRAFNPQALELTLLALDAAPTRGRISSAGESKTEPPVT